MNAEEFDLMKKWVMNPNEHLWAIEFAKVYHKAEMERKIERINNITQPSFSEILNELKQ